MGLQGGEHPRRHEARFARRARHAASRRAAVPRGRGPDPRGHRGRGRGHQPAGLQHPLQLRHPLEPQPPRAADGAHPPLRPEEGLPDLQLRRDEHHRGTRSTAPARQATGDSRRARRRRRLQRRRRGAAGRPRRARAS